MVSTGAAGTPVFGEITLGTLDGIPVTMDVEVVSVPVGVVDD